MPRPSFEREGAIFGDDRDYDAALQQHYAEGYQRNSSVSAYATHHLGGFRRNLCSLYDSTRWKQPMPSAFGLKSIYPYASPGIATLSEAWAPLTFAVNRSTVPTESIDAAKETIALVQSLERRHSCLKNRNLTD